MTDQAQRPFYLQDALIKSLPPCAFYSADFITVAEEAQLLHKINAVPQPTWRNLAHRRLQAHPAPLSPSNTLLEANLPKWLSDPIIPRLLSIPVSPDSQDHIFSSSPHAMPNHCLINEYKPGQGIHAHEDGDAYFPVVCTVSLGSSLVLDVARKVDMAGSTEDREAEPEKWRILQEPRSLLITTGEIYTDCMHGIEAVDIDADLNSKSIANWDLLGQKEEYSHGSKQRQTRLSLTFRDVIKVKRVGKAFSSIMK